MAHVIPHLAIIKAHTIMRGVLLFEFRHWTAPRAFANNMA
jgi:hypothetical protein